MVILGDKEIEQGKISVRTRAGETKNLLKIDDFLSDLKLEIATRK